MGAMGKGLPVDVNKVKYHNQFVMGPHFISVSPEWQDVPLSDSLVLSAHPDLTISQVTSTAGRLTLVGYILDPSNPGWSDAEILHHLMEGFEDPESFGLKTGAYGGRWVLAVDDGRETRLFNDAAGHRQVFYRPADHGGKLWCASQPRMLAEIHQLAMSPESRGFVDSYEFRKNPEFRWPGDTTPYAEVKHLLPNHSLSLTSGDCRRYWPDRPIPSVGFEEAAQSVAKDLRGLIQAAAHRFDLALSLTAGLDSRTVLAAARDAVATSPLMTVRQINKPADHADVRIPAQIASAHGLRHDVIESSLLIEDDFLNAFKGNTAVPHYLYIPDAQAILSFYGQQRVVVTGSISEIGRLSFRNLLGRPETEPITAEDLARLQKMGSHPFAVRAFQDWLLDVGETHNVPLLDLFEWEQGHGNWLAMCHLEFDIAWRDIFAPFNCRKILVTLLGVEARHRGAPDYELYRRVIEILWPELLSFPINPDQQNKQVGLVDALKSRIPYSVKSKIKAFLGRG